MVYLGIRARVEPVAARVIDRLDPEAISETVDPELIQIVGDEENFSLRANRQRTYSDGAVQSEGVTFFDHLGLVVTAAEASKKAAESTLTFHGDVELTTSDDGWLVHTSTLVYSEEHSLLEMEDPSRATTLTRSGLEASGRAVAYDRDRAIVNLRGAARVRLTEDTERATVDIQSAQAELAYADGYMHFSGGTTVLTGPMLLESENTSAYFGEEKTALERLELHGGSRIRSTARDSGGLDEMGADAMTLAFEETARVLERALLAGSSSIELVGQNGARGARIESATLEVALAPDGSDVTELEARGGVHLILPDTPDGARQEIRATSLTQTGAPAGGPTGIEFNQNVEFRERRGATTTTDAVDRVIQAERLEAGVEHGISALLDARFAGGVLFEDGTRTAEADEAVYDVMQGLVTLGAGDDTGRTPILTDATTRIEAAMIVLGLDGSSFEASGGVKSVLSPAGDDATESGSATTPGLLDDAEQILLTADKLQYDGETQQTTYTGQAHLWQGNTSFQGETLAVDDQTGNLTASGGVKTAIQLTRLNETTQRSEASRTLADGDTFTYDNATQHATYATNALLRSEHGDLKADTIHIFLEPDGRTLDRLEATGGVQLRLEGRWATGERLVYREALGRYEMEGTPVKIVQEVELEEPDVSAPPPRPSASPPLLSCRSTRGRVLTFYRSTDTVMVDGREELRTQHDTGTCIPLTF